MPSVVVLSWYLTTSGTLPELHRVRDNANMPHRLLDKIAKDIMVCENKTIRRWDGSIGEYKNYLRKKMVTMGQV